MSPPFWKVFEEQIGHPVIWKLPRIKGKIDMTSWGHFCDSSKWFEFRSKRSWRIQNLISLYCHDPRYRWPWWESLRDAFNLADVKFSCSEAPAKKPPVITCPIVNVPLSTQCYFSLESGLPFPHFCNSFFPPICFPFCKLHTLRVNILTVATHEAWNLPIGKYQEAFQILSMRSSFHKKKNC